MSSSAFMSLQATSVFMLLNNVNVRLLTTAAGTFPPPRRDRFICILAKSIHKVLNGMEVGHRGYLF